MPTWSDPPTFEALEVVTASELMTYFVDNLEYLKAIFDAIGSAKSLNITTEESKTTGGWGNLATVGPTIHVDTGPLGLMVVGVAADIRNSSNHGRGYISYRIRTLADATEVVSPVGWRGNNKRGLVKDRKGIVHLHTSLTPNTSYSIRARYQSTGTGNTAYFEDRVIWAIGA